MEIVNGTESKLQHSEKEEVKQKHDPSDDSSGPSGDSSKPSHDSTESSLGSSKLSKDSTESSSDSVRPSEDSSKSLSDSSSQPTSNIGESKLSESEYSSTESGKHGQPEQTVKLLNQMRSEKVSNTSNTEDGSKDKTPDQLLPEIYNDISQQLVDSFVKGGDGSWRMHKDINDKQASETSSDVNEKQFQSPIEGSKVDGRSDPSFCSSSTENSTLNHARNTSPHLYPILPDLGPNTSDQDLTDNTPLNQAYFNANNSSLRKRTHNPVPEPELLGSKSVTNSESEPQILWLCINYALIIITFLALIAVVVVLYVRLSSSSPSDKFSAYVREIKLNFPSQNDRFWKTLGIPIHHILKDDESKCPAVILMASSIKHASVALCIARNTSSALDLSVGLSPDSALVDFKDYKHLNAAVQKSQLDSAMNSAFRADKRRSFVLENLQYLDPLAALLLYSYCDNDYAPFKDVLIMLTLYFDDEKDKIDNPEAVENYLEMIWSKDLSTDKIKPLLARVANHIVIVQGESPEILNNACP